MSNSGAYRDHANATLPEPNTKISIFSVSPLIIYVDPAGKRMLQHDMLDENRLRLHAVCQLAAGRSASFAETKPLP